MGIKINLRLVSFLLALSLFPLSAAAHENYVLTQEEIETDVAAAGPTAFAALGNPENLKIFLAVSTALGLVILLYFFFQISGVGQKFDALLQKMEPYGHTILRVALGASLIASAHFNSFLGPEIPLTSIPFGTVLKPALYILGALMVLGLWSEIAGGTALIVLLLATWAYKDYMLTYFNYFGEFIALLLCGSRVLSLDKILYKAKTFAHKFHDHEVALIRVAYGISVLHPAIVYKIIHPEVIVDIANRYNLMQFTWLFPNDPMLIALGTGLTQIFVGLCIIFGFQTRLNSLITFILYIMSIVFFKEAVWPHYILLALAAYLTINNGGKYSLDNLIIKFTRKTQYVN